MGLLPENKKKVSKETPRNFVIFGETMNGKTFFSEEFPNPLNLNTDGNAEMIETPSINISHQRNSKGDITKSASELISDIIDELQGTKHTFETIVIDTIDDIITLFEQEITEEHNVKSVGDIGWGKGHSMIEMMVRVFIMRLKELSMKKKVNIIYISRSITIEENDVSRQVPSLKMKWMNIVNGNSDYTILCRKVGKNYIRKVESKRKNYTRDKVDDETIRGLLDTVIGAYDKSKKTSVSDAKKIVEQQEKQQEAEQKAKQKEREASESEEDGPVNKPEPNTGEVEPSKQPGQTDKKPKPKRRPPRQAK
ncbi:AAA family ATPase [Virgibacillus halodenitrificans]|uniref:AAA family ATPase n=1 Tax=Virgibacillus halodenitrificans TaxID=1482 RepID=UPI001F4533DA|nr:AAA family ATPase [Virgibacillus halodenitrificans]MCG1029287.1 AAA family ATPase [Virgibacillus halodenitrificans]